MEDIYLNIDKLKLKFFTEKHKPYMFQFMADGIIGEESQYIEYAWYSFLQASKDIIINMAKHKFGE